LYWGNRNPTRKIDIGISLIANDLLQTKNDSIKFLSKGKKYQALISVGQRRRMTKRAKLEKMERKGKREGVSSVEDSFSSSKGRLYKSLDF
jgi:hypothetical protein